MSKTYPRATTEEPNSLPRRGRYGGWMRNPSQGVPKLDGTNAAQRAWWEERSSQAYGEFMDQLQREGGAGGRFMELFDGQLERLEALKVQMPPADDFLRPHLKKLGSVSKPNPVHEAVVDSPPLAGVEMERLGFLDASLGERAVRRRRGRFLGVARARAGHGVEEEEDAGGEANDNGDGVDTPGDPGRPPSAPSRGAGSSKGSAHDELGGVGGSRRGRRSVVARAAAAAEMEEALTGRDAEDSARRQPGEACSAEVPRGGARKGSGHAQQRNVEASFALASSKAAREAGPPGASSLLPEPSEPVRTSSLSDLWAAHGASWIVHNSCVVPSTYPDPSEAADAVGEGSSFLGATLSSYWHTRRAASLFDVSFKVGFRVTGADREFVADQFLSCKLQAMRAGDVQYACILDSKGLMLDDAFVYLTADSVEILSSGCHAVQVADYLGQYIVYVRRSGADVAHCLLRRRSSLMPLAKPRRSSTRSTERRSPCKAPRLARRCSEHYSSCLMVTAGSRKLSGWCLQGRFAAMRHWTTRC